jgi:hypothetical protein
MRRLCIITGIVIALAEAVAAQMTIPLPTLPARKGAIENVWVEPAPLTPSTLVTCRVAVTDSVRLESVAKTRLGNFFRLRLFWTDPPIGTTATSVKHTESLGTLSPGLYALLIQSLYQGWLVDTRQVMFRVENAPVSAPSYIDDVWVEPGNPTTADVVTLHVSGEWGTPGYSLTGLATMLIGNRITVKMYWRSPSGNVPQVITPYEQAIEFPSLPADAYRASIQCYCDNRLVDSAQITFDVEPPSEPEEE